MTNNIQIRPWTTASQQALHEHLARHRQESGADGLHFMPFLPDDPAGPRGAHSEKAQLPLNQPGWQRWFCAHDVDAGRIIGHLDLKHDGLRLGMHWCQLGMGIEKAYRSYGLGERLMRGAIAFARDSQQLSCIELSVFGNNLPALALYKKLGFKQSGLLPDRFRIDGQSIDDVNMLLRLT
jgi:RimJ/RimL family protein N-acetyltransferase